MEMPTELDLYPGFSATLGNVTLRVPTIEETFALARVVQQGLFPDTRHAPIFGNWYDENDTTASARRFAGDVIADWGTISPEYQHLNFVILLNGQPVGRQSIAEEPSAHKGRQDVTTGSWIDPEYRWQGIGQKARWIILALAFQQLTSSPPLLKGIPKDS